MKKARMAAFIVALITIAIQASPSAAASYIIRHNQPTGIATASRPNLLFC